LLRLYVDEDLMESGLFAGLARRGFDVLATDEAGNRQRSDSEQLQFAATHGRAVYARNVGDSRVLHSEWLASGRSHAGVLVLTDIHAPIGRQLRCFEALDRLFPDGDVTDQILFLLNFA
jgi:hypothetical protein